MRTILLCFSLYGCASAVEKETVSTDTDTNTDTDSDTDTDVLPVDTDGDGLTDDEEALLGTSATVADTDGDGLSDGEEVAGGLNPLASDSDGDGYSDGDEQHAGTDPLDESSRIYAGGWPYNADKDALVDPGLSSAWGIGGRVPRVVDVDQFGDMVDLYDLANQGKPILLDFSAEWCGPCRDMGAWLDGNSGTYAGYDNVRQAVNNGDVIWVTFLSEDFQRGQPTQATVARWHNDFPNEHVPVLADPNRTIITWARQIYFPSTMWLNPDMTIAAYNPQDPIAGLAALSGALP